MADINLLLYRSYILSVTKLCADYVHYRIQRISDARFLKVESSW